VGRIGAVPTIQNWLSEWCAQEALRLVIFYQELGIAGFI
jgi:hypothetical protein